MTTVTIDAGNLENALRVAAEQFDRDAVIAREAGQERMAKQFDFQAKEARDFADGLSYGNPARVDGDTFITRTGD